MDANPTETPDPQPAEGAQPETPFHDLDHYLAIPRVSGLALSPDGSRLVTTVATLNGKGTEYVTALWELDPAGVKHARRITRSAKGEAGAAFAANGDLYFTSARPDPEEGGANVARLKETGAVGCNFEDQVIGGEAVHPLDLQVKRIAAIRHAVGGGFYINARTDLFLKTQTYDDALVDRVVERG